MDAFKKYWVGLTPDQKLKLSEDSGIRYDVLSQVANGHKSAGRTTIERLVRARPDVLDYAMFFEPSQATN